MNSKLEWEAFRVSEPSRDPKSYNVDCTPFDTVFHICHVKDACRIFEDGKIRPSLDSDEIRLRNSRTCVSWFSPNTWAAGSVFGNISFEFDWRKLVQGRKLFWVEGINYRSPRVYRILATDKRISPRELGAYEPTRKTGPIYYDSGKDIWYRNGNFNGEFLVDGDLGLEDCVRVTFVDHHGKKCTRKPCECLGQKGVVAGGRLLATLIGNRVDCGKNLFLDSDKSTKALHEGAVEVLKYLLTRVLVHPGGKGTIKASSSTAQYLATAIFARAGQGGKDGLKKLCGLFIDRDELRIALANRIQRHFRIRSACQLEELF